MKSADESRRLPESELDIMLVGWEIAGEDGSVTPPQIAGRLDRPLTASALHSYLRRLEEKGFLRCEKQGRTNGCRPLVTRAEYQRRAGRRMLDKLYAGSLRGFAAALYDGGNLTPEDVAQLRAYLDTLEETVEC